MEHTERKAIRLQEYDYSANGAYFITICIQDRKCILSTPAPTATNSVVAQFVSTFKRFCNKEYGGNIFQRSYHDHIIRGEEDYRERWNYIDGNPARWQEDELYTPDV